MHALIFYFAALLFFLSISVFFSASETALMAVNRIRLRLKAEAGDARAAYIQRLVTNPDKLLGVILLGNTVANIAAATLLTYFLTTYVPSNRIEMISLAASTILTIIILIFSELTPKLIAATHADEVSRRIFYPLRFFLWILGPFASLAAKCANGLVRLLGIDPKASPFAYAFNEEEIRAVLGASTAGDSIDPKRKMLHNVLDIGATQVREVMIPRNEVTAVEVGEPIEQILSLVRKTNYSRIPVYRESFDNLAGLLNVKDLLPHLQRPEEINIEALMRPAHFVPDTARLESVLRQFQSMHLHMAIVVDEFGGVEGIVTLEDLLEEIVGEIRDEHDTEMESIRSLGLDLYSVAGNLPVRDFNRFFSIKLPESLEYTTLAGFLQRRTGRLLQEGESVRFQDLTFAIEKIEGFKALAIRVRAPNAHLEEKSHTAASSH